MGVLIYPTLASWTVPGDTFMSIPTAIGWFYSCIVAWVYTFMIYENWPWTAIGRGSKAGTALASFFGNFLLGPVWYYAYLWVGKEVLMPSDAVTAIGAGINQWASELGIWTLLWVIFWANIPANWPTNLGKAGNFIVRTIIVIGLSIICFLAMTRWFAVSVLDATEIVPVFGGDSMGFGNLINLVTLIFIAYFGFWPFSRKQKTSEGADVEEA